MATSPDAPQTPTNAGRRIVVVGCGPKGLYCLERLCFELHRQTNHGSVRHRVTILEPSEFCGAGAVYNPRQPKYLRMNFAAGYINAWHPESPCCDDHSSLVGWLADKHQTDPQPQAFAPRAVVGEYLHDCFRKVLRRMRQVADVDVIRTRAREIQKGRGVWRVTASDQQVFDAEEVLVTVGHEGWRSSAVTALDGVERPQMVPVFPTEKHLRPSIIPAGSVVAVRGFGLSWIDAALSLTEGRGGLFEDVGDRWRYRPGGEEPKLVLPFSRTGRPMLAKPLASQMNLPRNLSHVWETGRANIANIQRPVGVAAIRQELWPAITQAAGHALAVAEGTRSADDCDQARIQQCFKQWCSGAMSPQTATRLIRHSVDVAYGRKPVDAAWALGEAWRQLYPAIVELVSHGGLTAEAWQPFNQIARELERISFGPPAENLQRVLALIDHGIIDLKFVSGHSGLSNARLPSLRSNDFDAEITQCINAVIPSAQSIDETGPLGDLLRRQTIRRLHGTLGIEVDRAGQPINDGQIDTEGLAILGRPTEGCILGNDTLSRTLHNNIDRWAAKVAERCRTAVTAE